MVVSYGEDEARSLFGLTNNLVIFGGGKDIHFYQRDLRADRRCADQPSDRQRRALPASGRLDPVKTCGCCVQAISVASLERHALVDGGQCSADHR